MVEEATLPVDFWSVLDEAQETVEAWPEWQRRYDADVYAEDLDAALSAR